MNINEVRRPRKDLSQADDDNPTKALQAAYDRLMAIGDVDELVRAATEIVQPFVGRGLSKENFRKFQLEISQSARKGIVGVQSYLTQYILKGSGLGVESTEIDQIASMISEDVNEIRSLTPKQKQLKNLVERHSRFRVGLVDSGQPYTRM